MDKTCDLFLPAACTVITDAALARLPMVNAFFGVLSQLGATARRQVLRSKLKVARSIPRRNAELKGYASAAAGSELEPKVTIFWRCKFRQLAQNSGSAQLSKTRYIEHFTC